MIEKSWNMIGQEHFGPYLRKQNFPKYEICSSIQQNLVIVFFDLVYDESLY